MIKKGNCTNCGCRFRFFEEQIKTDEDIFGNQTTYVKCPVCKKHVEPRYWTNIKR